MARDEKDMVDGAGTPTWVKVLAVGLGLLVVMVIVHLAMGGHGPGHHVGMR